MIKSFSCKDTESLFQGNRSKKWDENLTKKAFQKLRMLDASTCLDDLKCPPSNKLHPLHRQYKGYHGIWINGKWRVVFIWEGSDAHNVIITDYHK